MYEFEKKYYIILGRCYASDISDYLLRRILLETPGVDQPVKAGYLRMYAPPGTEGSLYGLYSATSETSAGETFFSREKNYHLLSYMNNLFVI